MNRLPVSGGSNADGDAESMGSGIGAARSGSVAGAALRARDRGRLTSGNETGAVGSCGASARGPG